MRSLLLSFELYLFATGWREDELCSLVKNQKDAASVLLIRRAWENARYTDRIES